MSQLPPSGQSRSLLTPAEQFNLGMQYRRGNADCCIEGCVLRTYTFDGYNEWWSTLHMCDICCDEIAVGSRCLRCDACDYDICPNCTAASDVALDLDKSFSCFLSAASDGHARAQYILGHCYEDGMGAPVDLAAAAMWYQRAAAQGIAAAGAAFVALDLSDCEIVVDRHDILHSTLESFSRVPDARLSSSEVVVEFREKGCLMHCLRLNPMPEQFFPSPADCHQRLRLVGILLGLSVSRRVPLGVDLTPAFCKLLLRHEANFEDLRAELPDEYEWMNDIKTAMQQASCAAQDPSHAADAKLRVNDEEHRRLFNTPSRRLQVWECINRLKEARPDAYGDMLGLFEERCLRHSGRPDDDEVLSFVPLEPSSQSGDAFVSGRNFEEYVASAVKKQLSTNLQEAMAHIYPPFEAAARYTSTHDDGDGDDDEDDEDDEDAHPAEELRCRLGDVSIADLQAQFSGDNKLSASQFVELWKRNSRLCSHQCVEWFWEILGESSHEYQLQVFQWSSGRSAFPVHIPGDMAYEIEVDADADVLPTTHACVGLGQITLPSATSKAALKHKLDWALDAGQSFEYR